MRRYLFFMLPALLLAGAGCDDDNETDLSLISEIDKQFILAATGDALFQVNAGQVATSGTTIKGIQDYGEEMTKSHTQAGQELQKLAADRHVQIPTTLSDDRQQQLDSLSMYTDENLDTLYLNQMVVAQQRVIRTLEIETTNGNDIELKQWASDRLPIVRQFAERARTMRDSLVTPDPQKK
ncbi:DUF4142 domain-containing protein [Dyadobacter sp. CY261]|uniref:DUF4142 domain-containing protein n=1 Tax=Dyadobacter sp. CY261 TaxID=2907203 RepID=UPI001F2F18AF|nr:DUF4142 domain-containing protein [Dyadobacter sp. CY261]MCF0070607.1 DUF4142 domain-containing protein [Dyadobacter sp. CY261]